jgi:filamentous hemagglutinin
VVTPGALVLSGSVLSANQVNVSAGALSIESLADSDTFRSRQSNISVSGSLANGAGSVSGNLSSSRANEAFNSVATQAGIVAGSGGFNTKTH